MPARRGDQGRFVDHPEIGIAKRATDRLNGLLYPDDEGEQTVTVEDRLAEQIALAEKMLDTGVEVVPTEPDIEYVSADGTVGAFIDDDGNMWAVSPGGEERLIGAEDDDAARVEFDELIAANAMTLLPQTGPAVTVPDAPPPPVETDAEMDVEDDVEVTAEMAPPSVEADVQVPAELTDTTGQVIEVGARVTMPDATVGTVARFPGGGNLDVTLDDGTEVRVAAAGVTLVQDAPADLPPVDDAAVEVEDLVLDVPKAMAPVGNATMLRQYWTTGDGAEKIGWGTDGDFDRCVALVSEYMTPDQSQGYCNLRSKEATGKYAGEKGLRVNHRYRKTMKALYVGAGGERVEVKADIDPADKGTMVALYPPDSDAMTLEIPDGVPAQDLHVTMAFLEGDVDVDLLRETVQAFAEPSIDVPVRVSGVARFQPDGDGDDAFVILVESQELLAFRDDLVDELSAAGFTVSEKHPFTPHITLTYLGKGDASPMERVDLMGITFGFLSVASGGEVYDYPLAADDTGDETPPNGDAEDPPAEDPPADTDPPADAPADGPPALPEPPKET